MTKSLEVVYSLCKNHFFRSSTMIRASAKIKKTLVGFHLAHRLVHEPLDPDQRKELSATL